MDEQDRWIVGLLITAFAGLFSVWWKVESKQDRKIDETSKANTAAHAKLYLKIDETERELTRQHLTLRDKIEDIWKEVVKK